MQITILKEYEELSMRNKLFRRNPEGLTTEEIESLEQKMNSQNEFPKTLREFLAIGGKFDSIGFDGTSTGSHDLIHTHYKAKALARGIKLRRPFFIITILDGKCFTFVYLDEGDNPQPWNCSIDEGYDSDENEQLWKTPYNTLSELILDHVKSAQI